MISLPLRLPSDNEIWGFANGRRYKTAIYKQFEQDAGWLLKPHQRLWKAGDRVKVDISVFWHNVRLRDATNCLKALIDVCVKSGVLPDDRYIYELRVRKFKLDKTQDEYCEIDLAEIKTGV